MPADRTRGGAGEQVRPSFSDPTRIAKTRFRVGSLTQVLQLGHEGGKPLRVEVSRLPEPRSIRCDGRRVDTVASQERPPIDAADTWAAAWQLRRAPWRRSRPWQPAATYAARVRGRQDRRSCSGSREG